MKKWTYLTNSKEYVRADGARLTKEYVIEHLTPNEIITDEILDDLWSYLSKSKESIESGFTRIELIIEILIVMILFCVLFFFTAKTKVEAERFYYCEQNKLIIYQP